jgi:penicillin amidase
LSKFTKAFIGISFSLLIIAIAVSVFLYHLVTKSFPQYNGSANIRGLHSQVTIYRDEYGVPHIEAEDTHDLMMATGYVHAQDRLWQMDLMRRAGEGRLSEILGQPTLDIDILFRTIGLKEVSTAIKASMHPESRQMLEDYAEGVNAFIESHQGKFPIEFDMLRYNPEPWKPEHSILIGRLIAWELNLAWWTDLTYGEIAEKVSPELFREIIPTVPDSIAVTVPFAKGTKSTADVREFMDAGRLYRGLFNLGSLEAGSNAWAVDSTKSLTGKPMLANDPHLAMPAPARWYLLHLSAPGWNVAGVSLPGMPVIVIGHNDRIAWGLTNAMLDDADFYIEQEDTAKNNHYLYHGNPEPFTLREETFYIKSSDSVVIQTRSTKHGPVINDVHPRHKHQDSLQHRFPVAMRWTGLDVSDELYGFSLMNRASTPKDFERGLKELAVPGQSVVYADVDGNIAYWTTGHVPVRGNYQAMLPQRNASAETEWNGFVPFDKLPHLKNPPEGFIACSNQMITDASYPYYLSTLWEPPSRITRIRELLQSSEKFAPEDFRQFQMDITSPYSRDITSVLLNAFENNERQDQPVADAITYLRNWDYRFAQHDVATTIFNAFFVKLLSNIYEDELGPDLFKDFVFFGAIPYRVTGSLMASENSLWFDNIHTEVRETKNEILQKSLSDAIEELKNSFGPEMKTWQWGSMHTVTFKHPFGSRKPLDNIFNVGPFPVQGGGTTLMKTEYKFTFPYSVSVGPSMRQIVDLSRPVEAATVITSGQSGQPLQKHYDDQVPLWRNGGYLTVTIDWNEIRKSGWNKLELRP